MVGAVIRFNYLGSAQPRRLTSRFAGIAIDDRIRGPLAAFAVAVFVTTGMCCVQFGRLQAAHAAYARAALTFTTNAPAVRDAIAQRELVLRKTRLLAYVDELQRANAAQADELTWIGNRLPANTWLHTLRYENGAYALEGSSDRASAVGTALLALRDERFATMPQLVTLQADGDAAPARVRYSLRIATQR